MRKERPLAMSEKVKRSRAIIYEIIEGQSYGIRSYFDWSQDEAVTVENITDDYDTIFMLINELSEMCALPKQVEYIIDDILA